MSLFQTLISRGLAAVAVIVVTCGFASAQTLSFGGVTDVDTAGQGIVIEYHAAPHIIRDGWSAGFGAALRVDQDEDAWVGIGFVGNMPLNDTFFVQASFMPGYYNAGETVLGGNLHFRSLIGLGLNVSDTGSLVLSIDHLSNGNLHETNPGAEAIALRYQMRF